MVIIECEIVVVLVIVVELVKLASSAALLASFFSLPARELGVGRAFVCEMGVKLDWILKIARKLGLGGKLGMGVWGSIPAS